MLKTAPPLLLNDKKIRCGFWSKTYETRRHCLTGELSLRRMLFAYTATLTGNMEV